MMMVENADMKFKKVDVYQIGFEVHDVSLNEILEVCKHFLKYSEWKNVGPRFSNLAEQNNLSKDSVGKIRSSISQPILWK